MKEPKDPRSTGRKRARRVLEREGFPYWCGSTREGEVEPGFCGRSPTVEDAPGGHYPGMETLQADHKNKNVLDNDPTNLRWACASCHKESDSRTEKGVSIVGEEYGYETDVLGLLED